MKKVYLVIDQGGQSSRVALYGHTGEPLFLFSHPVKTWQGSGEAGIAHIEQDADDILAGIQKGLDAAGEWLAEHSWVVTAAGYAGQGSSCLCWDSRTGEPLSPVFSWQDCRAEYLLQNLSLSNEVVRNKTGLRKSAHYGASKMRWALEHIPAVAQAAQQQRLRIGPVSSFVLQRLSGDTSAAIDPGHAQRTLLWNINTRQWDQELLSAFHLQQDFLPTLLPHQGNFGRCSLNGHVVEFQAVMRDQGASLFARGKPDPAVAYINMGTGAFLQMLTPIADVPQGLLASPVLLSEHAEQTSLFVSEATVNGAAAALDWLSSQCEMAITPEKIASALQNELQKPCYLLNAVGGLSAPYWRTDLESRFSGPLSVDEKIHTWIESVLFQLQMNLLLMREKSHLERIYISGGLGRLDAVCQKLANLSGLPLVRHENADATLQGMAYVVAGLPAVWQFAGEEEAFLPVSDQGLETRFLQWRQAMELWLEAGHE